MTDINSLARIETIYQFDGDRWRPFIVLDNTIQYITLNGIVEVPVNRAEYDLFKVVDTIYGTFIKYPVKPPAWAFVQEKQLRRLLAERSPVVPPAGFQEAQFHAALAVLGLALDYTQDELRAAHRDLVRQHHPDAGGDAAKFTQVSAAYALLRDRLNTRQHVV